MKRSPQVMQFRRRGFMLLEALIAILIFTVGVLGVIGLQAAMTKAQTSSKFRSDAAFAASELMGTMWTDAPNLASYSNANCANYARCADWKNGLARVLPGGQASVTVDDGRVSLIITWMAPGEPQHTYQTSTQIRQ